MRNRFGGLFLAFCAISAAVDVLAVRDNAYGADRPVKTASVANAASPPVEIREFDVRVDNTVRGTHRLTIKSDGPNERAEIQTDVRVDVIIYVYAFKSRGTEIWRDGRLLSSDIRCDDNGKKRAFALKMDNDIQQISFNEKSIKAPTECVMSNAYWRLPHADLRTKVLPVADADTGKTYRATLVQTGTDTVTAAGRSIACRRFKIDGVSPAELWFDDRDFLVRQTSVEQGHATELRLKQIRVSND